MLKKLLLTGMFWFFIPAISVGDVSKSDITGTWNVEHMHLEGKMNGHIVVDRTEEAEEGDYITFNEDGTFKGRHRGEEQEGEYTIHPGSILEILNAGYLIENDIPENHEIEYMFTLDLEDNTLYMVHIHTFTNEGQEIEMKLTVKAGQ